MQLETIVLLVKKIRVDGALKKYRNLAETAEISVSEQLISFIEETKDYKLNNKEKKRINESFCFIFNKKTIRR